jgi:probable rRNA maturation factor
MNEPDQEIALQNPNRFPDVRARRLRPWLERLLRDLAPRSLSFGVRFTGDREMQRVNRAYRGLDKTTDVLSFPGSPASGPGEGSGHLGDVLISVPSARRQAAAAGHGVERELRILLLHGVLHCLGHDHETDEGQMERLEKQLRRAWIPRALGAAEAGEERGG